MTLNDAPRWQCCSEGGETSWWFRALARRPGMLAAVGDNDRNFYLWGAMGGAAMIGLGLAIAQPNAASR